MPETLRNGLEWLFRTDGWRGGALSALAGFAMALGQAPFSLFWVALPAMALALGRGAYAASTKQAAMRGWTIGFAYALVTLFWIIEPFLVDVQRHGWMAPFALGFMATGFGLFWGLGFGLATRISGPSRPAVLWTLAFTWTAVEFLRAYVFTGFPWALLSYIWIDTPVYQVAALLGPHGLTLATLLGVAVCVHGLQRASFLMLGAGASTLAGLAIIGTAIQPAPQVGDPGRPVVRLIQPNADQTEKWDPEMIPVFFERQLSFTAAPAPREPDLVVWPEVAVPFLLNDETAPLREIAQAAGGASVILGAQRVENGQAFNSLALLNPDGTPAAIYDKRHLVPFGEYIPGVSVMKTLGLRALAARAARAYTPGSSPAFLDLGDLGTALPMICYEAIFPHELRRTGQRPDWLLLITNDAWFGKLSGPYQHLAQAQARTIETGLPMVRVANTGVSGLIDAAGRLGPSLPLGQAGYLDVSLPRPAPTTLYWRTGDLPVAILLTLMIGALLVRKRVLARRNTD